MAFSVISDVSNMTNKISDSITLVNNSFLTLENSCMKIINYDSTFPSNYLSNGGKNINIPKITFTDINICSNPVITPNTSYNTNIDPCHLNTGLLGTTLKAMMTAVSIIWDNIIQQVYGVAQKISKMFLSVVEYMKSMKKWLINTISSIWEKIKKYYENICKNNNEVQKGNDNILKELWKRAKKWGEKVIKEMGLLVKELEDGVEIFIKTLNDLYDELFPHVQKFIQSVGDVANDIVCLMKKSTILLE